MWWWLHSNKRIGSTTITIFSVASTFRSVLKHERLRNEYLKQCIVPERSTEFFCRDELEKPTFWSLNRFMSCDRLSTLSIGFIEAGGCMLGQGKTKRVVEVVRTMSHSQISSALQVCKHTYLKIRRYEGNPIFSTAGYLIEHRFYFIYFIHNQQ